MKSLKSKGRRRAYQLGVVRCLERTHRSPKARWVRLTLVDYGSFTGAIVGAVGTILAGFFAWEGVQEQINYQRSANELAEFTTLQGELDRLYVKLKLSYYLGSVAGYYTRANIDLLQRDISLGEVEKILHQSNENTASTIETFTSDLEKGAASIVGLDTLRKYEACKSAEKMVSNKKAEYGSELRVQIFEERLSIEEFFNKSEDSKIVKTENDGMFGVRYLTHLCVKDSRKLSSSAADLMFTATSQIKRLDNRLEELRLRYTYPN